MIGEITKKAVDECESLRYNGDLRKRDRLKSCINE